MALTKTPIELSSTPSIVDNGNATAITIDSSENVGIGGSTITDSNLLNIQGSSASVNVGVVFNDTNTSKIFGIQNGGSALKFFDYTASTERMRIDSIGNVGIGSSPVVWSTGMRALELKGYSGTTKQGSIAFDSHSGANGYNLISTDTGNMVFYNGATNRASAVETMRIDSSGNLLVGQSSTTLPGVGNTTAGVSIRGDDGSFFSRALGSSDTNNVVSVNRSTADGNILGFQKDGTTVGSIGSYSSDRLFIGAGDTNITFKPSHDIFYPSTSTGAARDNAIDLGDAGARFKDIYLSGGVNFSDANGGQTFSAGNAANTLSDYEVGTFTATLKGGTSGTLTAGYTEYTKIGNTVHCRVAFLNVNTTGYSGHLRVEGLPFPMANSQLRNVCTPAMYNIGAFTADYVVGLLESSTHVNFYAIRSSNSWNSVAHDAGGSRYLEFNVTYNTNA